MKLRDYQERAVDGTFAAWDEGRSALVVLPTGCGKTIVFASVIQRLLADGGKKARVLVLAHREELIAQAKDKIAMVVPSARIGIEMAELKANDFFGQPPEVVVSSVQTQNSGKPPRMEKFAPKDFAAVIVDEAHHAIAKTYRRVIDWFLKGNPACKLLGVTATPDRKDEAALGSVFERVACDYGIADAISDGWLVPIRQQLVSVESLDYSGIRTCGGDLNQKDLAEVMEQEENLQRIAAPTLEIVGNRRAIVFAASVKQAERLAEILNRGSGKLADWISGETPKDVRRDKLERFKRGELRYMVNVGVLTEGFDDAGVDVVVMARPTKSRALYAQMAGRATRPAAEVAARLGEVEVEGEGEQRTDASALRRKMIAESSKPTCLIVDFVGNSGRHKLVSTIDILGGRYDYEVVARAKEKMKSKGAANGEEASDVSEALETAKREIEAEKAEIERKRKLVLAKAKYVTRAVDPFDRYDLVEAPAADPTMIISSGEERQLRKLLKKKYALTSLTRKQALVNEMRRRRHSGEATLGQEAFLRRRGFVAPMRAGEARRAIDRISRLEGWGW